MRRFLLTICDRLDLFSWFNRFTRNKAPVFMLHHFCEAGHRNPIGLPADILEECLGYMVSYGYQAIPLSAYVNRLIAGQTLHKTVVFTVDDGHADFLHHGFPVFRKYDIPVAVFLATSYTDGKIILWWNHIREIIRQTSVPKVEIDHGGRLKAYPLTTPAEKEHAINAIVEGAKTLSKGEIDQVVQTLRQACEVGTLENRPQAMSWENIAALETQGVEFYPHTCEHPILSRCSGAEIRNEIYGSLKTLASHSRRALNIFCYPNGRECDFDGRTVDILKEAGFVAAFTTIEGFDRSGDKLDMFRLRRYSFPSNPTRFKQLISGLEVFKHGLWPH